MHNHLDLFVVGKDGGIYTTSWHEGCLGKGALLAQGLEDARERGLCALGARGTELDRDFPFGVVRQLLEPRVAVADEEERGQLFADAAALAEPLFHAASGHGAAGQDPPTAHSTGVVSVASAVQA